MFCEIAYNYCHQNCLAPQHCMKKLCGYQTFHYTRRYAEAFNEIGGVSAT